MGETKDYFTVKGAGLHKYIGLLDLYGHPTLIVPDRTYKEYQLRANAEDSDVFYGFMFEDVMQSQKTAEAIDRFIPERFGHGGFPANVSYIGCYRSNFALYYKLIMEAQEEKPRYAILKRTGMKNREILASIAKQLGMVYGLPLLFAAAYLVFYIVSVRSYFQIVRKKS